MDPSPIDQLLDSPAFADAGQTPAFRPAFDACLAVLRERFPRYAEFLDRRPANDPVRDLPAVFLPVLKAHRFELPPDVPVAVTLTSSGTTGRPAETPLDEPSWRRRVKAMRASYEAYDLFPGECEVLAFLLDPATTRMAGSVVIDAVLREIPRVRAVTYLARRGSAGPEFHPGEVAAALETAAGRGPVVFVGYPALVVALMKGLAAAGRTSFTLQPGSGILTGGGWKSFLPGVNVDQEQFRAEAATFFGLPPTAVRDMYGLSECPAVFVQCEQGKYHVPAWALARAIDPATDRDVPAGQVGLLELTVPLTTSYPLLKILTTDKAELGTGCACGRGGTFLVPRGRVSAARFETCAMTIGRAAG